MTRRPSRARLALEALEDRCTPAIFHVTSGNDAGPNSLRVILAVANTNGEADSIFLERDVTLTSAQLSLTATQLTSINGNGHTVTRSTALGTANFRIFIVDLGAKADFSNLEITNGKERGGGGIANGGTLTLSNSTLSGNTASTPSGDTATFIGGGIYNEGTLTVTNSTLSGNTATYGGGIFNLDAMGTNRATLTITNSTLSGNTASSGGGIYNHGGTLTLTLSNSTLSGNTASTDGGGIYNFGTLSISNSTLSGNTASSGGGIYSNGNTLSISNSTLSGNTASSGGGIFHTFGTLTCRNTIVAGNFNSAHAPNDLAGIPVVAGSNNNLIGDAASAGGLANGVDGNKVGLNPLLGPLQNNGGATRTHALLPGSPAINAGSYASIPSGLATDQRGAGFARVFGDAVDIGAFEVVYTTKVVYDSHGNMLVQDISGRADNFTIQKSGTNFVVTNPGAIFVSPVGTVSADGSTLTVPLSTVRGRLTIAGGDGDDKAHFILNDNGFPRFFGSIRFDGGAGTDTLFAAGDVSATLSDSLLLMSASKRILLAGVGVAKPERVILVGGASANIFDARSYTGFAILDGGLGNDKLLGSTTGRNILIGGRGNDTLVGGQNQDILIGGTTTLDLFSATFTPLITTWAGGASYTTRVLAIRAGTGLPAGVKFTTTTVPDDGAQDSLTGGAGLDWFWAYTTDLLQDKAANEFLR